MLYKLLQCQMTERLSILFDKVLSQKAKHKGERMVLYIAILSFLVHLTIIYLSKFGIIKGFKDSALLSGPIAAIYTPFSFILVYEVYLLIYYLPKSITTYIRKQYEIITLIVIRRIFKDLANLELSSDWFEIKYDLQFTYDIIASIILFGILYLFHSRSRLTIASDKSPKQYEKINRFIIFKKSLAFVLVPILIALASYTFGTWIIDKLSTETLGYYFKDINDVFFDEFFTLLIIVDVILLLVSFFHTDEFHKVIRNSGFIISTILIRLSFSVDGLINTVLIVAAVLFGLIILMIYNQYESNRSKLNLE